MTRAEAITVFKGNHMHQEWAYNCWQRQRPVDLRNRRHVDNDRQLNQQQSFYRFTMARNNATVDNDRQLKQEHTDNGQQNWGADDNDQ